MLERRRTPRYATDTQAEITVLQQPPLAASGTIRNISAGGLQFVTAAQMQLGACIRLQAEEVELDGRVLYCCRWQSRYVVGIVIDDIRFNGAQLAPADLIEYWAALQEV